MTVRVAIRPVRGCTSLLPLRIDDLTREIFSLSLRNEESGISCKDEKTFHLRLWVKVFTRIVKTKMIFSKIPLNHEEG